MACDIHLYVEVCEDGKWKSADQWHDEDGRQKVIWETRLYSGRNYELFAILADVRNGRGFAGCDTGDRFNPIAEPRGLPADVCKLVSDESESWGVDGHSHSWHTLADLLAYNWTQTATLRGYVNGVEFEEWERVKPWRPFPRSYCGDVGGGCAVKVSAEAMREKVAKIVADSAHKEWCHTLSQLGIFLGHTYCQVQWQVPYAACCGEWWTSAMPRLLAMGRPENVRIVFWFDN